MARIGITQQDVFLAASKILKAGSKTPTVDSLREMLGTGSKTTIARHLKTWKEAETDKEISGVPAHLIQALRSVYQKMKEDFDAESNLIRDSHSNLISTLHDEVSNKTKQNNETQQALDNSQRSLEHEIESRKEAESHVVQLSKELAVLNEKQTQSSIFKDYLEKDNIQLKIIKEDLYRKIKASESLISKTQNDNEILSLHLGSAKEKNILLKNDIVNLNISNKQDRITSKEKNDLIKGITSEVRVQKIKLEKELLISNQNTKKLMKKISALEAKGKKQHRG